MHPKKWIQRKIWYCFIYVYCKTVLYIS